MVGERTALDTQRRMLDMIDGLKPYSSYTHSGLDTIGAIPDHWKTLRAKVLFREVDERSVSGKETLLSVSHISGVRRRTDLNINMFLAKSNAGYKLCRQDDLVVNTMWAWMGALGVSPYAGIVSPSYAVYRPQSPGTLLTSYTNYLLRTRRYVDEYTIRSSGIHSSRLRLYPEFFLRIPFFVPPPDEQAAIVCFLDHANRRIDRFIRAKKKLIALLNEQKQAIIHRAVTRGLDPNVPMKDSGIPWLGEIPAHWRITRLALLSTRIGDGLHGTPQYVEQSPYYFINGNNLVNGSICLKSSTRCVGLTEFQNHRVTLDDSSILVSINGTIGSVAFYKGESIILGKSAAYINCRKELSRTFLFFFFQSPAVVNFLKQEVTGTTIFNLSLASLRRLPIVLPPFDDQLKIVSTIEKVIGPISNAIMRVEREIELIREYRTRLITDVVTGQLDVREAAAGLPQEFDEPEVMDEDSAMDEGEAEIDALDE